MRLILSFVVIVSILSSHSAFARGTAIAELLSGAAAQKALETAAGRGLIEDILGSAGAKAIASQTPAQKATALIQAIEGSNNEALKAATAASFKNLAAIVANPNGVNLEAAVAQERAAIAKAMSTNGISISNEANPPSTSGKVSLAKFAPKKQEGAAGNSIIDDLESILRSRADLNPANVEAALNAVVPVAKAHGGNAVLGSGAISCLKNFGPVAVGNFLNILAGMSGMAQQNLSNIAKALIGKTVTVFGESAEAAKARFCSLTQGTSSGNACPLFGSGFAPACE